MSGDLDWPLNALRGLSAVSWVYCAYCILRHPILPRWCIFGIFGQFCFLCTVYIISWSVRLYSMPVQRSFMIRRVKKNIKKSFCTSLYNICTEKVKILQIKVAWFVGIPSAMQYSNRQLYCSIFWLADMAASSTRRICKETNSVVVSVE